MIVTNELPLLEYDELLTLVAYFLTVAKSQLQLLVLKYLDHAGTRILVMLLIKYICLQISKLL